MYRLSGQHLCILGHHARPVPLTCSSRCLASNSPVTLDQLQQALGPVSRRTTFRYLRQVRHLRSYNHNGRFYTDRDPARFDRFGLLSLGDVHFSRDGSLPATVRRLLDESEDGCTDREL